MKIIVEVTDDELKEMNVNPEQLKEKLYQQLDDATLERYLPAIFLVGYNIEVIANEAIKRYIQENEK